MIEVPTTTYTITGQCPTCSLGRLVSRRSVTNGGIFLGCSRWPACNHTSAYDEALQALVSTNLELEAKLQELAEKLQRLGARAPRKGLLRLGMTHLKVVK